mmetsp:Transcript_13334/g.15706  ORF Transcript_13334/g.15706 Transcript_13334/m.15706 type:complete len:88 (+) Transcript_13334:421-684(+)
MSPLKKDVTIGAKDLETLSSFELLKYAGTMGECSPDLRGLGKYINRELYTSSKGKLTVYRLLDLLVMSTMVRVVVGVDLKRNVIGSV